MQISLKKGLTSLLAASALLVFGFQSPVKPQVQAATLTKKQLPGLNYGRKSIVTVNNNKPSFSKGTMSTKKGAWQTYSNLDSLNRAREANALLNKKLMPKSQREALYWDPTGWHNKRIAGGWLYNRCHLIGYQLTGQNNNPKNLITGTRQLNDPDMLKYENMVANYVKSSKKHYVRYRVTPIFRGRELLARGVEMEGQSVGSNAVRFNVYIFNVQPGVKLNYANGTSVVSKAARTVVKAAKKYQPKKRVVKKAKKTVKKAAKKPAKKASKKKVYTSASKGKIIGNKRSKIYHVPGQAGYHMNSSNAVYFNSERAARAAGYRKAKR